MFCENLNPDGLAKRYEDLQKMSWVLSGLNQAKLETLENPVHHRTFFMNGIKLSEVTSRNSAFQYNAYFPESKENFWIDAHASH